ncbi:unnamed protein product [Rotaria sp. Silwood1]|nr:unnamed protein product [Rotaria sp. Silwood1]
MAAITDLATPSAFARSPSLVWEFYHYRRELMRTKEPNKAHLALAEAEKRFEEEGKHFFILTQNIDGLHRRAGSRNLLEIHGNLFTTRCTSCGFIEENNDSPICEALRNRGLPNENGPEIALKDLPSCRQCQSLVRPHVVWFEESLWPDVLKKIDEEIAQCDLFLVVGTSAIVYPAAAYAMIVATRGIPVAEVNIEKTPSTSISTLTSSICGSKQTIINHGSQLCCRNDSNNIPTIGIGYHLTRNDSETVMLMYNLTLSNVLSDCQRYTNKYCLTNDQAEDIFNQTSYAEAIQCADEYVPNLPLMKRNAIIDVASTSCRALNTFVKMKKALQMKN